MGLRLGIISDAHLSPPGTTVSAFHTGYETADIMATYRLALRRCIQEDVDGIVLLGDLSQSGAGESLETGLRLAAETGIRVWAVSGNHDCFERADALDGAVQRVAADNVQLATLAGEVIGDEPRIAGLCVTSGNQGYRVRSYGDQGVDWWGNEPTVLLTHYPMISFAEKVSSASLIYGDDLEDLEEVARPLLERPAPTVVVNGHIHLRHACVAGELLQVSCAALVEPPFEITLLEFEADAKPEGGREFAVRFAVRRRSVPLDSSSTVRCPALSPPQQEWAFEDGTWHTVRSTKPHLDTTESLLTRDNNGLML